MTTIVLEWVCVVFAAGATLGLLAALFGVAVGVWRLAMSKK
jgi:hypothetical protein